MGAAAVATTDFKSMIEGAVDYDAVRDMMIRLVQTPSPQTELMEAEPRILAFIKDVVEPELRACGVEDIGYDGMGNLIARLGHGRSGKRVMMATHAMNAAPAAKR
jgi:putative aminopeptidase FrvX